MAEKGYSVNKDVILINRDLTDLDIFLKDFLDILKGHADYLVVSGFVSISTGRVRGTEDIDVLFLLMNFEKFSKLFNSLEKNGFWCFQGDSSGEVHDYVKNFRSIRFSRRDELFPNIEFIPVDINRKAKYFELMHPQKIKVGDFEFKIPPLEFEILYKEFVLKSKKDLEDARHLRVFFSEIFDEKKFEEYKPIVLGDVK